MVHRELKKSVQFPIAMAERSSRPTLSQPGMWELNRFFSPDGPISCGKLRWLRRPSRCGRRPARKRICASGRRHSFTPQYFDASLARLTLSSEDSSFQLTQGYSLKAPSTAEMGKTSFPAAMGCGL